jgi:hypothetical protein
MVAGRSRVDAMPFRAGEHRLHWKDGKLSLRFTHTLRTPGGDGGIDSRESDQTAYTTLPAAVRAWSGSSAAAVSVDVGWTDATRISTAGENVVSFTDTAPCRRRHVRQTNSSGLHCARVCSGYNPRFRLSSLGFVGTLDLGVVMLHEVGHAFGLNPFVESGGPGLGMRIAADGRARRRHSRR